MIHRCLAVSSAALLLLSACTDTPQESASNITSDIAGSGTPTSTEPEDVPNEYVDDALLLEGRWSGQWINESVGYEGEIVAEFTVDERAETLNISADLSGLLFGTTSDTTELFSLPIGPGLVSDLSPIFGDWDLNMEADGSFTMTGHNPPPIPNGTFTARGVLSGSTIVAAYEFDPLDGTPANTGTFSLYQDSASPDE